MFVMAAKVQEPMFGYMMATEPQRRIGNSLRLTVDLPTEIKRKTLKIKFFPSDMLNLGKHTNLMAAVPQMLGVGTMSAMF